MLRSRKSIVLSILPWVALPFLLPFLYLYLLVKQPLDEAASTSPVPVIATLIVSVIGTASTIFFAWRSDRRAAKESDLKTVQMQRQIAELELKLKAASEPPKRLIVPQ